MKIGFFLIPFLLFTVQGFTQVEEYFYPAENYFNRTFTFKTDTWENEEGRFHTEYLVNYFKHRDNYGNLTGNIIKRIHTKHYRFNVLSFETISHDVYNIENNIARLIFKYTEGLSDELKELSMIKDFNLNEIVLKYPPNSWEVENEGVKTFFEPEFGEIITEYGKYPCIIVTETMKSENGKVAWVEKFTKKHYYAKNLGLIKIETYENPGKLIGSLTNFGSLIDNFSQYSFSVLERKETEENELQNFLLERETRIFNYQEVAPEHYYLLKSKLEEGIKELLNSGQEGVTFNLKVELNIDTLGITTKNHEIQGVLNEQTREKIHILVNNISLNRINQRGYAIFAQANYSFNVSHSVEEMSIRHYNSNITFQNGDFIKFQDNQQKINEKIIGQDFPDGHYQISLSETKINTTNETDLEVKAYNSFAGPSSAFASILVPGLGKKYVTGGEQKGIGVTLAVYSFVGSGIASKLLSNSYYDKYHAASTQSDMDNHYDLANNLNQATYFLLGTGALLWLHNIYWVANRGSQNKKNKAIINQRISPSFSGDFNNLQLGLTIKF